MVEERDNNWGERHQKDAEGIVLFTGLFSAALAALITVTIQDLRPAGPQDSSPFTPPTYAVWVNSLWISSLAISITCALLATLIQQWTRRYVQVTQPQGCAHKRARIRQYIFNDGSNAHFLLATDAVPTLLHLSVFLFFAGLLILLRHIDHTVFNAVVGWVVLCYVVYAYITLLPIFRPHSPHYAPLSSLIYHLYANILYPVFEFLSPIKRGIRGVDVHRPAARLLKRLEEKAEKIILVKSPKLDAKILESLLVTLSEDGQHEKLFEAIPDFYDSKAVHVDGIKENLSPMFFTNFWCTINRFLDQTLSSDSVSELVRCRRLLTCLNATHRVLGDRKGTDITNRIIRSGNWIEMPPSPEIGHILRRWRNATDSSIALIGSCIIARIIANVEKRDDTWMALARSQLGVNEEVLKGYLEHGDSVLLANLIKTTRLFFEKRLQIQGILRSISRFNVKETLPELQHDFCTLWDEIVKRSEHFGDCILILNEISHVHDALHPTDPMIVAALPTSSTTANNDSLLLGPSHKLCTDPQPHRPHHPPNAPRQVAAVAASSSSSPLGVRLRPPPLQGVETEIQTHMPPPLGYSYSTTTSHTLATPRDVSVSDPDVIVVAGERDVQDLSAHNRYQSDPPVHDISMSTSPLGKSIV